MKILSNARHWSRRLISLELFSNRKDLLGRLLFGFAIVLFFVGIIASVVRSPELLADLDWGAWLLVLVLVPLTMLANGAQLKLTAGLICVPMSLAKATGLALISTAANILPIPGGTLVRIKALKTSSNGYREISTITVYVAISWAGIMLLLAGLSLFLLNYLYFAVVSASVGGFIVTLATYLMTKLEGKRVIRIAALIATQIILATLSILRIWLCCKALGAPISLIQAAVIAVSGVVAAVISVAPAGIGVTEVSAAALAAAIGITPAAIFLAVALNRVSGQIVLAPIALIYYRYGNNFLRI